MVNHQHEFTLEYNHRRMRRNSNDDDEYQSETPCYHICVCEAVCGCVSLNFELIPEKENSGELCQAFVK